MLTIYTVIREHKTSISKTNKEESKFFSFKLKKTTQT